MIHFDPSEIDNWASKPEANHKLPELIRRLILASKTELTHLDIPSGSAVWQEGWDGLVNAKTGNAWLPEGLSAWELSCQTNPNTKASNDYRKRTSNPQSIAVNKATFVFVTPRRWSNKQKWLKDRLNENKWADIRAFDASDLSAWLEQAPAVSGWFARLIGKHPADGCVTIEEWWENWATVSQPNISPSLVLAGRLENADKLSELIQQKPSHYYVQGHTGEEGIAFIAASAIACKEEWGAKLLAKALVVKSENAWNTLKSHTSPLALIRAFDGNSTAHIAVNQGHHVITPVHSNENPKGNGISLAKLGRDETITALTEMGLSETKAKELAWKTSRRLPIIRRFLIAEAGGPTPDWASPDNHNSLPSLVLIGQWDESNKNDQEIVAEITGQAYDEISRELSVLAQAEDSPLTKIASYWHFLSHEEAWHLLAPRLTTAEVQRFQQKAILILETESPEFEMPIGDMYIANFYNKVVPHSELLRAGIARTLALMGNHGDQAKIATNTKYVPEKILRHVLKSEKGWQTWATLNGILPTLAEAAPEAFLYAIERCIDESPSLFSSLLTQGGTSPFGSTVHTGLLSALEKLAWKSIYFARVANILVQLTSYAPSGHAGNRPDESLAAMFLPWYRVSETLDTHRLETLNAILNRHPEPGWEILIKAYPAPMTPVAMVRESPFWITLDNDEETQPTAVQCQDFIKKMEQLLLAHVDVYPNRWKDITNIISHLSPDTRHRATELMSQNISTIAQHPDSPELWSALRKEINRHRSISDAKWAMPAADLESLDNIYQKLTPDNPEAAHSWLFDHWPHLLEGTPYDDTEYYWTKIYSAQQTAIENTYESKGIESVMSIAASAQKPEEVGRAFVEGCGVDPALALVITHSATDNRNYRQMMHGIFWAIYRQFGWTKLEDAIVKLKKSDAHPQALAQAFLAAPAETKTWERLNGEASAVQQSYWEQLNPYQVSQSNEDETCFVAQQLLVAKRSPAVAEWIAYKAIHHEIVIQTLAQLPQDLAANIAQGLNNGRIIFAVVKLLKQLDESDSVDEDTIAQLELPFVSALTSNNRPNLVLYRKIANEPALFADLISSTYKRDDGEQDFEYNVQETLISTNILTPINLGEGQIPGKEKDGTINYELLSAWVKEARRLCSDRQRIASGDTFIGHLLAKSPIGQDEIWPCEAVRELLEETSSQYIENGFISGTINLRGVTSRAAFSGGDQERNLVQKYWQQANAIMFQWPRTAKLLQEIANFYQREAERFDQRADEMDQLGY